MLKKEKPYDFRKRMLTANAFDVYDGKKKPEENQFVLQPGTSLYIPEGEVCYTAAVDFCDFCFRSMNTPVLLQKCDRNDIVIKVDEDSRSNAASERNEGCRESNECSAEERLRKRETNDKKNIVIKIDESYKSYKSYRIEVGHGIRITAHDERGAAQALFALEEMMLTNHAPFVEKGIIERAPLYSPRMTHSGYGLDMYPDEHLLQIAKAGMDAILVFTVDINETPRGYLDFNELIFRAAKYGIDVYAYSYKRVFVHPEEPGAYKKYDDVYGRLFRECPGLKGVVLVGESVGFPSRDENAAPCPYDENMIDGLPTGKPSADMWPCKDYNIWIEMLQKIIYKENPEADIVFWTYNWGNAPKEHRINLIKSLPTNISLLVTYETFHKFTLGDTVGHCADYTLAFTGPGEYFVSEAEAASEMGIRLYAMSNTGGQTWDFGMCPYEPMPYQWIKRYKTMKQAHDDWGLCGLMESHHYGFYPSFISALAKQAFEEGAPDYDVILQNVLKRFYGEAFSKVDQALQLWSEAITYYNPTNEDQYGAFRLGPVYPFNLGKIVRAPILYPSTEDLANSYYVLDNVGKGGLSSFRIGYEIENLDKMLELLKEGQEILEAVENPNEELEYLTNLGKFLCCCVQTGVNMKRWYLVVTKLKTGTERETILTALDEAEKLLELERKNVKEAMPCIQKDSRLGWEPRIEYHCTEYLLDWKLRQLDFVQKTELTAFRNCLNVTTDSTFIIAGNFMM